MAEVKTKECDMPDCHEVGADVLAFFVRTDRLVSNFDLYRLHRQPIVTTVQQVRGWRGRSQRDAMDLAAGELLADL